MRYLVFMLVVVLPFVSFGQAPTGLISATNPFPWSEWIFTGLGLMTLLLAIFALARAVESLAQRVREKSQE